MIKGLSEDVGDLASYLKDLKKNKIISQINLLGINRKKELVDFGISIDFKQTK